MTRALIYLRSATGNQAQTQRQEADCRAYLRERDLLDAGTVTDTAHPQDGLTTLIDTAAMGCHGDFGRRMCWFGSRCHG